jgi:hypothetical protein
MAHNFIDMTGLTIGMLWVVKRGQNSNAGKSKWECVCFCGNKTIVWGDSLRNGNTKSCGCLREIVSAHKMQNISKETKLKMSCGQIGKVFTPEMRDKIRNKLKGQKISVETRRKMSNSRKGKNNPHWGGGKTNQNRTFRKQILSDINYTLWREAVFKRDDYTCQKCKKRDGSYLHAHHTKEFQKIINDNKITTVEQAINTSELWDVNNGTTLCLGCHKKEHKTHNRHIYKKHEADK